LAYANDEGLWVTQTGSDAPEAVRLDDTPGSGRPLWYPDNRYLLVPLAQDSGGEGASPTQALTRLDATGQDGPAPLSGPGFHDPQLGWIVPGQVVYYETYSDEPGAGRFWIMWDITTGSSVIVGSPDSNDDPTPSASWVPGFGALRLKDDPDTGWRVEGVDIKGKVTGSLALSGAGNYDWLGHWHLMTYVSQLMPEVGTEDTQLLAYWGAGGPTLWAISPRDMELRFLCLNDGINCELSRDGRLLARIVRADGERKLEIYEVPGE